MTNLETYEVFVDMIDKALASPDKLFTLRGNFVPRGRVKSAFLEKYAVTHWVKYQSWMVEYNGLDTTVRLMHPRTSTIYILDKARDILDGHKVDTKGFTKRDLQMAIILVCNERGIEYKGQWL